MRCIEKAVGLYGNAHAPLDEQQLAPVSLHRLTSPSALMLPHHYREHKHEDHSSSSSNNNRSNSNSSSSNTDHDRDPRSQALEFVDFSPISSFGSSGNDSDADESMPVPSMTAKATGKDETCQPNTHTKPCVVCQTNVAVCVALPCGHMYCCVACANDSVDCLADSSVSHVSCALCRCPVDAFKRVYT